jgi:hypothetical protein
VSVRQVVNVDANAGSDEAGGEETWQIKPNPDKGAMSFSLLT